jgi:DNA-binding transcriptional LysR family regulator
MLKVDHATVSRRLSAFEASLGVSLVERLPRACRLTPIGFQVYEQVIVMESAAFAVELVAFAEQGVFTGNITLGTPPVLAAHLLAPRLAEFRQQFPHLQLSISAQAQRVSISRREADVVLRLVRPEEPSSVIRKVGQMQFGLYASAAYLAQHEARDWSFIAYNAQFADMPQQK